MTLNASGPISLGGATTGQSINLELGNSATALASINSTQFRTLAGVASGQISLSNFYGKSNTIGWFASFGRTGVETEIFGVGVNSSGTVYFRVTNDPVVVQISNAGAITYQRQGYINNVSGRYNISVDSSSNFYVLGEAATRQPQITKYNSSNTFQWSSYWTETDFNQTSFGTKPVIDSSGNVYFAIRGILSGCCFEYFPGVRRVNSSGSLTGYIAYTTGRATESNNIAGAGVDSSGNVYLVANGYAASVTTAFIGKCNSSFTFQSRVNLYATSGTGVSPYSTVFDSANNVGYVVGSSGAYGIIFKYNTSLSRLWSYSTTDTGYWSDCAVDSSGNLYAVSVFTVAGSGIRALKIIKLDTNGSLQWARYVRCTTLNLNTTGPSIAVNGTILTVAAQLSGGTTAQNRGFVMQVPTSGAGGAGSGTTFTNNARTWTYASYTETLVTTGLTDGASGGPSTISMAGSNPTTPTLTTPPVTAVTTTL